MKNIFPDIHIDRSRYINNPCYVRWRETTRTQLGYTVNLLLGLSVGSLAFPASKVNSISTVGIFIKAAYLGTLISFSASALSGLVCVINRLFSFRLTAQIVKYRISGADDEQLYPVRKVVNRIDSRTWKSFWFQIFSFGLGICLFIINFFLLNLGILFS